MAQLYREFGQPTEREGSTYRWREVYVLDKPAQVTISMDQSHGLWEGSYAWDFPSSGTKSDDLVAFGACFHVHTGLMMSLLKHLNMVCHQLAVLACQNVFLAF